MADHETDRSEEATPHKLRKARERAQTPRSADAVSAAAFLAAVAVFAWQGADGVQGLLRIFHSGLVQAGQAGPGAVGEVALDLLLQSARLALPPLLVLPIAAFLCAVAQTGLVFSFTPLQFDLQRLNPATGFQRVFSRRTLFEAGRACAKLAILAAAAWAALAAILPQFHVVSALPPAAFLRTAMADVARLGWWMAAALVAIAAVDVLFTHRDFARRMRMSRRELRDEFKQREGDPRIRARLRELRREMLRRSRALRNTRDADVVLTNPTHYAVALRYVHGEMDAPKVVAKGAGQLAAAMREIAARHRIIVVQNPPLARRLFREAPLEDYLPPAFHAEVARIFVWILASRQRRAAASGAAA